MHFFVGLHQPSDAQHFERCMISVNRLKRRKSDFKVKDWMLDSGAFSEIKKYGCYRQEPEEYAEQIERWSRVGNMRAAATQDYPCEPFATKKTGLSVQEHQERTVERYEQLKTLVGQTAYLLPVLQGWTIQDYVRHLKLHGSLLERNAWVGVGSVCKRNSNPEDVARILVAILLRRPDLRLHGFGLKISALQHPKIRQSLYSADSMAWSFSARMQGRNANDWREAEAFVEKVENLTSKEGA